MKTIFYIFSFVFISCTLSAQDVYRLEKVQSNVTFDLLSISLSADDYGCISGRSDTILITHDGGKSWKPKRLVYTDDTMSRIVRIRALDSLTSYATVVQKDKLIKVLYTTNGWLTHEVLKTPTTLFNFIVKNIDTIFYLGANEFNDFNKYAIRFSYDDGKTWTKLGTVNTIDDYNSLWINKQILIVRTNVPDGNIKQHEYTLFDLNKNESRTYRQSWGGGVTYPIL